LKIPFTRPCFGSAEIRAAAAALRAGQTIGNGAIGARVEQRLCALSGAPHAVLTPNATQAMEVLLTALGIGPGDEVIVPSFAYVSMANAVVQRGARPVFAEIDERHLNLDPEDVARKLTPRTKVVMPVHYAGIPADLDRLVPLCKEAGVFLFEDAAQAIGSTLHGRWLGTLGDAGCWSFHETKNVSSGGEGGVLLLKEDALLRKVEISHEKGTNRKAFLRGEVDKYTWVDRGGSYVLSDLLAAVLEVQLERLTELTQRRMDNWVRYHAALEPLERRGLLRRPYVPPGSQHNAHIYYVVLADTGLQERLLSGLRAEGIGATFHFQPLHASPFAVQYLQSDPKALPKTLHAASCILRLPLFASLTANQADFIAERCLAILA
jgi:dTDP-4-amino-4,6-dideoxygalactose transaminase